MLEVRNYERITKLYSYVLKRFPDPTYKACDDKIFRKSEEQIIAFDVIEDCFNNISRDPEDVIFDKSLYYEACLRQLKKEKPFDGNKIYFADNAIKVLRILIDYLQNC